MTYYPPFSQKRVYEYKKLRTKGFTYQEIGNLFGVTRQAVHCGLKRLAKRES